MPILRTVANLWRIERGNAEAKEIAEKAGEIRATHANQIAVILSVQVINVIFRALICSLSKRSRSNSSSELTALS